MNRRNLKEFQRLKEEEQRHIGWNAKRELAKINYRIHTGAVKANLIPAEVTPAQAGVIYASEADVLNVALFGLTAREWRDAHHDLKGNIRDYASINERFDSAESRRQACLSVCRGAKTCLEKELICLSNIENLNAVFIEQGMAQRERLLRLNQIAIHQMQVLADTGGRKLLK